MSPQIRMFLASDLELPIHEHPRAESSPQDWAHFKEQSEL